MSGVELDDLKERLNLVMYPLESWYFDDELCKNTLLEHFHVKSLEGLGVVDFGCGVIAAGALLIEEAGGVFTMPYEAETDFGKPACILAANPQCLAPAHEILMCARDYIEKGN